MDLFQLSQRELDAMCVLERIKNGELTQAEAAQLLKKSDRHVRRMLRKYRNSGPIGLGHRGRGKRSNRRLDPEVEAKIN